MNDESAESSGKRSAEFRSVMPSPDLVAAAASRGVRRALAIHKALGVPVATWRDEQVVIVQPADLPALDFDGTPGASG